MHTTIWDYLKDYFINSYIKRSEFIEIICYTYSRIKKLGGDIPIMNAKNYAEVLIDGKIYTLGGSEEENYLQKVASYINEKMFQLRRQDGFSKQSQEYQAVMLDLNIADEYFKAKEDAETARKQSQELEKETYGLKHELITTQMKLETALRDLEEEKKKQQNSNNNNNNNYQNRGNKR